MKIETPLVKIIDGWERVPSDQILKNGDKFWHPWHLKFNEVTELHVGLPVKTYEDFGSIVIRKKGDDMNRDDPVISPGWERVPNKELIVEGYFYWNISDLRWQQCTKNFAGVSVGDYEKHGSMVIRKKVTQ